MTKGNDAVIAAGKNVAPVANGNKINFILYF